MNYYRHVLQEDGTWDKKELNEELIEYTILKVIRKNADAEQVEVKMKGRFVDSFIRGLDGMLYALCYDVDYSSNEENGMFTNVDLFSMGSKGESFDKVPIENNLSFGEIKEGHIWLDVHVLSNGDVLAHKNNGDLKWIDSQTGEVIKVYDDAFVSKGYRVGEGELYRIEVLDNEFGVYDIATGEKMESADFTLVSKDNNDIWNAVRGNDGMYVVDNMGIYFSDDLSVNGFERIVSSVDHTEFSDYYMEEFFIGPKDELFVLFYDDQVEYTREEPYGNLKLCKYDLRKD